MVIRDHTGKMKGMAAVKLECMDEGDSSMVVNGPFPEQLLNLME